VVRAAREYSAEYRIIRPSDGQIRWIAARAEIDRDAQGRALRLVGAHIDVTALKEVEAALRASEERYRLIVKSATDYAIFSLDLDGHVTSWNTGAERILGYAETDVLGRPGDLLFTPEDREAGAPDAELRAALEEESPRTSGGTFAKTAAASGQAGS
jgi:two-component system CheB/CheR fusion protein